MKTISGKVRSGFMLLALCFMLLAANPIITNDPASGATYIILQSKDGGQTWQDISHGLPEIEQGVGFYAGASEVYLSANGVMYRSTSNLKTPVWEKVNGLDARSSIAFNGSGAMAHTYDGKIYQKK